MKKYLFLLAFILPFMAMGQKKKHGNAIPHGVIILPKILPPSSHTSCSGKDSTKVQQWGVFNGLHPDSIPQIPEQDTAWMPNFGATGLGPGYFTGTPTKMVTQPQEDSIAKGYIFYLKKYPAYRQVPSMIRTYLMEGHPATAHYHASSAFRVINPDGTQFWQANWEIYKIEVDGKPFDLNKYYQFIPDNQVVE